MVFAGNGICLAFWGSTKLCGGQWSVNKALFLFSHFPFSCFHIESLEPLNEKMRYHPPFSI
jgi:hypothetical protein